MGSYECRNKDISVPSSESVVLPQHLQQKLGWVKLWPKTAQPFLLYTRGCSDNVIVMISEENELSAVCTEAIPVSGTWHCFR